MDSSGKEDKKPGQCVREQRPGWIWQYFILRGQEPWSGLRTHLPEVKVETEGSSNSQASEMQQLKDYLYAVTNKQVLEDAITARDGKFIW